MEMISSEIKIGMQECILHHIIQSQTTKIGEPEKILKIINFCAQSECRVICNFYSNFDYRPLSSVRLILQSCTP